MVQPMFPCNVYRLLFPFFLSFIFYLYVYVCVHRGQKRTSSARLELELQIVVCCQIWCGYWDLNSGSLKEQQVLFISELSLQPTKVLVGAEGWRERERNGEEWREREE